ncbi:phage transcriptional regulator, ArpU family [Alkalibacterium subtropicum]|uniref:Phage transcriptional regulator, ArpU family n=1 Tax=Alkalibacterium subtropicum TaxID=753702 RepID=A0A1I1ETR0_9LACT|nr:ArpU family phage packaging/lysis transcriptional regulator [Alkalibacterium subtropicum]SFB90461.1 phage transcriptional regulator, ArpU family [Alkalibacterium subtropicum]
MFPEIDNEKTKGNVHRLLSHYRSMARLADEEYTPKITATFSLELKGSGGKPSDQVGNAVARKVTAERELWKIGRAMNKLNAYHRQLLHDRYIDKREFTDVMIYMDLGMSKSTYYRELENSLIEFAESYDSGRLLVEIEED